MEAPEAPQPAPVRQLSRGLSVEAAAFQPATTPGKSGSPVKPVRTRDVFETLDYVPFTPSQGICTPSPSNIAAAWVARRAASGELPADGSMAHGAPLFHPALFHTHAMPYSPGAHAFHGFHGPGTPSHAGPWSPAGPAFFAPAAVASPGVAGAAAFVGSPAAPMVTPGRAIFAQYLAQEGYASGANSPGATSPPGASSGSEGSSSSQKADNRSSDGEMNAKRSPGARDAAAAWCAERGIEVGAAEPPAAIVELASLALSYGITVEAAGDIAAAAAAAASSSVSSSSSCSPVKMAKSAGGSVAAAAAAAQQQNNEAGGVRLNARQRRTLRRAHERAMAALEAMQRGEDPAAGGFAPHGDSLPPASFTTPVKGGSGVGFGVAEAASNMMQAPMPVAFGSPAPVMWPSPVGVAHPHAIAQPQLVPTGLAGPQAAAALHFTAAAAAAAAAAAFHPQASIQMGAMPVSPGPSFGHAAAAVAAAQLHLQQQQQQHALAAAAAGAHSQFYQQAVQQQHPQQQHPQQQQFPRSGGRARRTVSRFAPATARA